MFPILDGHNDTLLRLYAPENADDVAFDFFAENTSGHLDLPRARVGGLRAGFFAMYVRSPKPAEPPPPPPPPDAQAYAAPLPPMLEHDYALNFTLGMFATLLDLERRAQGQARLVRTVAELETCLFGETLGMIAHIEGAEAIGPGLEELYVLHAAGLRSLGPVWSRPTIFGHGVPFRFPADPDTGPGLTDAGRAIVRACNALGVLVDLSHMNEQGFWDIARLSEVPLVATHSGAHALCPSTRNLTDRQLDAIGESGGLVGVNFHAAFLCCNGRRDIANTRLSEIVRHIDYIATRIGIEHVALGSDFDGATMPADLGDVAGLPRLIAALQAHGYDDAALRAVTHGNWLRVLRQTWR